MALLTPEDTTIVVETSTQTDASVAEVDSSKGNPAAAAEVPARETREVRNSLKSQFERTLICVRRQQLEDGNDSSYGDDIGSDLNYGSVSSSIFNYRVENGRTYHAVRLSISNPRERQISNNFVGRIVFRWK
jgi:hypothetical protein